MGHIRYPYTLAGQIVLPFVPPLMCESLAFDAVRLLGDCMSYRPRVRLVHSVGTGANDSEPSA